MQASEQSSDGQPMVTHLITSKNHILTMLISIVTIIALAIVLAIVSISFNLIPSKFLGGLIATDKPVQNGDGTFDLPIDPNDPSLREYAVTYQFSASVLEIKQNGDQAEIITNLNDPNIPPFITSENTHIYFAESPLETYDKASINDIKPGDQVKLVSIYFLKRKFWRLGYVFLPPNEQQRTANPSPGVI